MTFSDELYPVEKPAPKTLEPVKALSEREELTQKVDSVRTDAGRFIDNYRQFQKNYPEIAEAVKEEFPKLDDAIEQVLAIVALLSPGNKSLKTEEIVEALQRFNRYAELINRGFKAIQAKQEARGDPLHEALNVDASVEVKYSEKDKKEMQAFAKALYEQIFPESYTSQFVRWSTGQGHLEDYQRILVAPAEGIEGAVMGFVSLFNPKTYADLETSVETACGMDYEEWCLAWKTVKTIYENSSTTDLAAPAISLISGCAFLLGGVSKLATVTKGLKVPAALIPALEGVTLASRGVHYTTKMELLPIGVLSGLTLKYAPLN